MALGELLALVQRELAFISLRVLILGSWDVLTAGLSDVEASPLLDLCVRLPPPSRPLPSSCPFRWSSLPFVDLVETLESLYGKKGMSHHFP